VEVYMKKIFSSKPVLKKLSGFYSFMFIAGRMSAVQITVMLSGQAKPGIYHYKITAREGQASFPFPGIRYIAFRRYMGTDGTIKGSVLSGAVIIRLQ
jgi:hypothetical protein